jgi:hypothetical protein
MAFANEYSVCAYWLHGGVAAMGFATADAEIFVFTGQCTQSSVPSC